MRSVIFSLLLLLLLGAQNRADANYVAPEPIVASHGSLNLRVDPKIELISVVQTIGKYQNQWPFLMNSDPASAYRNEVLAYFSKHSQHAAVQMFDRMSGSVGFCFSFPANAMIYVDDSLNMLTNVNFEAYALSRMGGRDTLAKFMALLKDFAAESDFNGFFASHCDYYNRIIANTSAAIGNVDYVAELSKFYGYRYKSYNIVLVSLYNYVGYGFSQLFTNNERVTFDVMGAQKVIDGDPSFGSSDYLKYMIRHEFSHPYVNPLTLRKWDYIKGYADNYSLVNSSTCGEWQECINEFVIRAITTSLAQQESADLGEQMSQYEKERGVLCLDYLLESLKVYQANRDKYPTFDTFYSKVLDVFKNKEVFRK